MNPHDLAAYVKGWEYIIAILFNLFFLMFWATARRPSVGEKKLS